MQYVRLKLQVGGQLGIVGIVGKVGIVGIENWLLGSPDPMGAIFKVN